MNNYLEIKLLRPFPVIFVSFVLLHLIGGWEYYLRNSYLLFSTLLFFLMLWFFCSYLLKGVFFLYLKENSAVLISSPRKIIFYRLLAFIGGLWGGIVWWAGLKSGLTLEELRAFKSELFPTALVIVLNAVGLSGFCLLLFSEITRYKLYKKISVLSGIFIAVSLVGAALTGTRVVLAPYLWFMGVFLFSFSLISAWQIMVFGGVGFLAFSAIKLIRIIYSDAENKIDYYIQNGVYDPDNWILSIWNIVKIHLEDNPWRAFMVFEYVPERMDFQYGKSTFFEFYSLLPGEQMNPHVYLSWNVMYGAQEARGYPPTLLGQGWLDFGFLGSTLYAVLYPVLIYCVLKLFVLNRNLSGFVVYNFFLFNVVLAWYGVINWLFFLIFLILVALFSRVRV